MPPRTPRPIVTVDVKKKAEDQTTTSLHNRWHPDIPPVSRHVTHGRLSDLLSSLYVMQCTGTSDLIRDYGFPHQVGTVKEGDLFRVETVEWTGGQIKDDDSAEDVKTVDLTKVRPSSLPVIADAPMRHAESEGLVTKSCHAVNYRCTT